MDAYEIAGVVSELTTALVQLQETASDKESDLQTKEEDIQRARAELDGASNEWDDILRQLIDFNPERLQEAIEEAERLLGDS